MTMDKQAVEQGRIVLDQYRQAHAALYAQGLTEKALAAEHERLLADLNTAVSQLGFASLEQMLEAEKHYAQIKALDDYNQALQTLAIKGSAPIRYADITDHSYVEQRKILKNVAVMRAGDEVEDVVILGGVIGLEKPIVTAPEGHAAATSATGLGLTVVYQPAIRTTVFMMQHDLAVTIITKGRFADRAEARMVVQSFGCQLLNSLGVSQPFKDWIGSNNVMVGGRKLGSAMVYQGIPSVLWSHFNITLDFNYDTAAVIYQDAAIRDKVTTVKYESGVMPPIQDARDAAITVGTRLFDSKMVIGSLSQKELEV